MLAEYCLNEVLNDKHNQNKTYSKYGIINE